MPNDVAQDLEALAASGGLVAYFGYGSLVNRATLRTEIVHAAPARLFGWRRTWRARPDMPGFPAALLTVRPVGGAVCDGLLVFDRAENLAAVDAREARYRRAAVARDALETAAPVPESCPVFVYEAEQELPPHPEPPKILRSYLDAVLQGFLVEHGEAGLARFLAETEGFDMPIHDDRAAPVYPRAVTLSQTEQRIFERLLAERSAAGGG